MALKEKWSDSYTLEEEWCITDACRAKILGLPSSLGNSLSLLGSHTQGKLASLDCSCEGCLPLQVIHNMSRYPDSGLDASWAFTECGILSLASFFFFHQVSEEEENFKQYGSCSAS